MGDATIWVLIAVLVLMVIIGIISLIFIRKTKYETDYQTLFMMGIIWFILGFPLKNFFLSGLGLVFVIAGLINIKKWEKNRKDRQKRWKKMSKNQKKFFIWLQIVLLIGVLVGIAMFLYIGHIQKNSQRDVDEKMELPIEVLGATIGSECLEVGTLNENYFYNENSKTWWIDIEEFEENEHCNPACVIYEDLSVEVNWRCQGV